MDLVTNHAAPFTRWVVASGYLKTRFVLVDVGVQDGPHPRWSALGPMLEVHGFDVLTEAIEPLRAKGAPNHHYYDIALGPETGTAIFHTPENRYETSFYDAGLGCPTRRVPMETLDHMFRSGRVPRADFVKIDVEGFEPEVLKGAREYLAASPLIGAEIETSFNISPVLPETHFWGTYRPLLERGLLLFDVDFLRHPRPPFSLAQSRARPSTWEILLARDLPFERYSPASFINAPPDPTHDDILKSALMFELFGMVDVAHNTVSFFRERLDIDIGTALSLFTS